MGLFSHKTRAKPDVPQLPVVFVTHDHSHSIFGPAIISRFFFIDELMAPSKWVKSPDSTLSTHVKGDFQPDQDSYRALMQTLKCIIIGSGVDWNPDSVRCYPHYIAITWEVNWQPEGEDAANDAQVRIEREVTDILNEYFGWVRPIVIGRFRSLRERFETAERLGINWSPGSYS